MTADDVLRAIDGTQRLADDNALLRQRINTASAYLRALVCDCQRRPYWRCARCQALDILEGTAP